MAIRHSTPVIWRPKGLSDAVDGSNAFQGAMTALANLVPDPSTALVWVPRPAATLKTDFASALGGPANPGTLSSLLVIGNIAYGLVPSSRNAGRDEPFALNLAANAFLTVGGILVTNTPLSPPSSGDWEPPIMAQVGSRILVTHPGFDGVTFKFGWFDISGFSESTTGDTTITNPTITGAPAILGVQPGMTITGAGITAGTTVVSTANFTLTTTGNTHTNTTLDNLVGAGSVAVGMTVAGSGILAGTTVAAVVSATQVTLSQAANSTGTGIAVTFTGATITMSANATATATGVALTIAGGTAAAPLWGAGDTDRNNLVARPVGVAQMNGRAYFVLGTNGIAYSDSGLPCRVSNTTAVQALTTNDGLASTAIAALMLSAPITGGIVQSLIVFEGASKMQQITGDQALGTLAMNALPVATGTLAPLSITPCQRGTAFVSPDGLRIVGFDGSVSDVIGDEGQGTVMPFIFAVSPSQICGAANIGMLRFTVQNGQKPGEPYEEYCLDLARKIWHGPHSFPSRLTQPWTTQFLQAPVGFPATLYQSTLRPSATSTYSEPPAPGQSPQPLTWIWETVLLPDNQQLAMNSMVEAAIAAAASPSIAFGITVADEGGVVLDTLSISVGLGAGLTTLRQRALDWHEPIVFKQMQLTVSGNSDYSVRVGNLYMRYEILGYNIGPAGGGDFLLDDVGGVLSDDSGTPLVPA